MHPAYTSALLLGAIGAIAYSVYCYLTSQNENERYSYAVDVPIGDGRSRRRRSCMEEDPGWGLNHRGSSERGYRCAICQDTEDGLTEALKCRHEFHVLCIQRWLTTSRRCPICRAH